MWEAILIINEKVTLEAIKAEFEKVMTFSFFDENAIAYDEYHNLGKYISIDFDASILDLFYEWELQVIAESIKTPTTYFMKYSDLSLFKFFLNHLHDFTTFLIDNDNGGIIDATMMQKFNSVSEFRKFQNMPQLPND